MTFQFRGCVSVLGPPAIGKSSLTTFLAELLSARLFRLRDFARYYRQQPGIDQGLFDSVDSLGWLSDETVEMLLSAVLAPEVPGHELVLMENFPGSVHQLRLVVERTRALKVPFHVVELTAPKSITEARSQQRRVCVTCEPDEAGDPHRPALPHPNDPALCRTCAQPTQPRAGDDPEIFAARSARFRARISAIRDEIDALGVTHTCVDAQKHPAGVAFQTIAGIASQPHLYLSDETNRLVKEN